MANGFVHWSLVQWSSVQWSSVQWPMLQWPMVQWSSVLHSRAVRLSSPIFDDLSFEDPDLHANGPERGLGRGRGVVDVRAQRVKRHATLVIALHARDFRAPQSAAGLDLDPLRS